MRKGRQKKTRRGEELYALRPGARAAVGGASLLAERREEDPIEGKLVRQPRGKLLARVRYCGEVESRAGVPRACDARAGVKL